jgi:hypothetical protein
MSQIEMNTNGMNSISMKAAQVDADAAYPAGSTSNRNDNDNNTSTSLKFDADAAGGKGKGASANAKRRFSNDDLVSVEEIEIAQECVYQAHAPEENTDKDDHVLVSLVRCLAGSAVASAALCAYLTFACIAPSVEVVDTFTFTNSTHAVGSTFNATNVNATAPFDFVTRNVNETTFSRTGHSTLLLKHSATTAKQDPFAGARSTLLLNAKKPRANAKPANVTIKSKVVTKGMLREQLDNMKMLHASPSSRSAFPLKKHSVRKSDPRWSAPY